MSKTARILFITVYVLIGFGLVMTYSASAVFAEHVYHDPYHLVIRQLLFVVIGTVFLFVMAAISPNFWKDHARGVVLFSMVLLVCVFIPKIGVTAGGARRWINLGFFNFQPAELAKLAICVYLSDYLARKIKNIKKGSILIYLPPILIIGATCLLTILQPDLGSTVFIFLISAILFFLSGIRLRYVITAILMFIPALYFLVIRFPYRLSRVTSYLNPWDDPQGSGFQMIQSLLAFGLGGVHGVGLGQSSQKLFYLPSSHNDFILSVVAEELGVIGIFAVMILYAIIFICGIHMAENAQREHDRLLIISITLMIVLQALINMMVATGLIPTKGLPLPFVSYGGTSMVVNLMGVGLLLGLDYHLRGRR